MTMEESWREAMRTFGMTWEAWLGYSVYSVDVAFTPEAERRPGWWEPEFYGAVVVLRAPGGTSDVTKVRLWPAQARLAAALSASGMTLRVRNYVGCGEIAAWEERRCG